MKPQFTVSNHILKRVIDIKQVISELKYSIKKDLKMRKESRIQSVHASLKIENNSLTLNQITDVINGIPVIGRQKDILEAKNLNKAYEDSYKESSLECFIKAHQCLTEGLIESSGSFRMKDVGVYDSHNQLIHLGARPPFIYKLMSDLLRWIKEDETPTLIKSCIVHYEIEAIHPFEDGNGRMGRLWQKVMLVNANSVFSYVPIETVIHKNQERYYQALATSNAMNDSCAFIEFMLDAIYETLSGMKVVQTLHGNHEYEIQENYNRQLKDVIAQRVMASLQMSKDFPGFRIINCNKLEDKVD